MFYTAKGIKSEWEREKVRKAWREENKTDYSAIITWFLAAEIRIWREKRWDEKENNFKRSYKDDLTHKKSSR